MNRRNFLGAVAAYGAVPVSGAENTLITPLSNPISMTLLRAAAGDLSRLPGGLLASELKWNAVNLLHVHLDEEVGLYDWAAPELRNAAAVMMPGLQTFDLGRIEDAYDRHGLPKPDRGLLSRMAVPVVMADLSLVTADGRAMSQAFNDAILRSSRSPRFRTGPSMHPLDNATTVAGGAVLAASGVGLINIGITVGGAAGATFASSAVAAAAVVSGVALLVIGVAVVGYAVSRSLGN